MRLSAFLQKCTYSTAEKANTGRNQQGTVLVLVMMLLLLFTTMGILLMYMVTSTIKSSGLLKMEDLRFYGAEGGVLAVAAYMTQYHQVTVPHDVTDQTTPQPGYHADHHSLGQTIAYPIGYSTLWVGENVYIDSISPP